MRGEGQEMEEREKNFNTKYINVSLQVYRLKGK